MMKKATIFSVAAGLIAIVSLTAVSLYSMVRYNNLRDSVIHCEGNFFIDSWTEMASDLRMQGVPTIKLRTLASELSQQSAIASYLSLESIMINTVNKLDSNPTYYKTVKGASQDRVQCISKVLEI